MNGWVATSPSVVTKNDPTGDGLSIHYVKWQKKYAEEMIEATEPTQYGSGEKAGRSQTPTPTRVPSRSHYYYCT